MSIAQLLDHINGLEMTTVPPEIRGGVPEGVRLTGAPLLWAAGITGKGVVIANIDTGVDAQHPDLRLCPDGRPKILSFRDYVNGDGTLQLGEAAYDDNGHGTHTAGTQTASGALKGVAPGAQLRAYKCLNAQGGGQLHNVTRAVNDAVADGCRVLSMSLGTATRVLEWADAIKAAVTQAGRLVIVAAGNSGPGTLSWPACEQEVISVGAVGIDPDTGELRVTWFSTQNPEVDLAAHGDQVLSTLPGGGYGYKSGTSMAAPAVAGLAALLLEQGDARLGEPMTEPAAWQGLKTRSIPLGDRSATGAGFASWYPTFPRRRRIQITQDNPTMLVDGELVELDVPAQEINGRLLVPFRRPLAAAGADVGYNANTQTATADFRILPGMEV